MEFVEYCITGNLEKAKLVISNISQYYINRGFESACISGHIEIARVLYGCGEVDIHADDEFAFRWACQGGHMEIARVLYRCGGVDIHAMDEYAFQWACNNGHFEIVKWLYFIGRIDMNVLNNYRINSNIKEWLYSMGWK